MLVKNLIDCLNQLNPEDKIELSCSEETGVIELFVTDSDGTTEVHNLEILLT